MTFIQTHLVQKVSKNVLGVTIAVLVIGLGFFAFSTVQKAEAAKDDHENGKVDICHATNADANPYNGQSVDKNATASGHDDHDGGIYPEDNWGDIIPPYDYWSKDVVGSHLECPNGYPNESNTHPGYCYKNTYHPSFPRDYKLKVEVEDKEWVLHHYDGKNWTDDGQEILRNNCEVPQVGTLRVCKVIVDSQGNYLDGSTVQGTDFSVTIDPEEGDSFDVSFSTALDLNTDLFGDDQENDAECQTYEVNYGSYDYSEENIDGNLDSWEIPLYDELTQTGDFEEYNTSGNSNGNVVVSSNLPERTIVVKNTLKPLAKVVAQKVVCDDEAELPNWGDNGGGPNITESTAEDWVEEHDSCHFEEGWNFQWAPVGTSNPGDNNTTPAGGSWTTVGPTDGDGMTMFFVNLDKLKDNSYIWMREILQEDYIPFSGTINSEEDEVSAEFYCNTDVLNYDNYDRVDDLRENNTYYCVGFNAPKKAKIVATKVVCEDESDLPNWAQENDTRDPNADHPINENTAQDWVDQSEGRCWLQPDWEFEWATPQVQNGDIPPVDHYGYAAPDYDYWHTFGPTDENGMTMTFVDAKDLGYDRLWVREVLQDGYIPFIQSSKTWVGDVSAEMYCHLDGLRYDNHDKIEGNLQVGETYYCVAFNTEIDNECVPGQELVENGGFEAPVVTHKAGWDIFDSGTSGLAWAVQWLNPSGAPDTASLELHGGVNGWLPYEGEQYTELDGDWQGPGGTNGEAASTRISQNLPTVPGETYKVSFAFSPRPNTDDNENILNLYWDGGLEDTLSADGSSNSNTDWATSTYEFVASSNFTELAFEDGGDSNSLGTFLDDVSVMCKEEVNQCEPQDGDWADNVEDYEQGKLANGSPITDPLRTDPTKTLGAPDGLFYSLGRVTDDNGWVIVSFDQIVPDIDGDDISIHEVTNGRDTYPEERAQVEVSQDGSTWYTLSEEASSKATEGGAGVTLLDFSETGLSWIQYVKLTDTTNYELHSGSADGFDVDAVDATQTVCEPPEGDPTKEIVVVTPSDLTLGGFGVKDWYFYDDTNDLPSTTEVPGDYEFVSGPSTPPMGVGSVEMSVVDSERWNISTVQFAGTDIADMSNMAFWTYQPSSNPGNTEYAVYLHFDIDFDNTTTDGYQGRLVYVPRQNHTVSQDSWEEHDAYDSGNALWWWSGYAANGNKWPDGNTDEYRTWDDIVSSFPNAEILDESFPGQLLFRAGEPYPSGFTGAVDSFNITIGTHTIMYDFEPEDSNGGGDGGNSDGGGDGDNSDGGGSSGSGSSGGSSRRTLSSSSSSGNPGEVLGAQTQVLPAGAPNTGGGGMSGFNAFVHFLTL